MCKKVTHLTTVVTRYIRNASVNSRHINSGAYYCNQHPQVVCLWVKIYSAVCVEQCASYPTVAPSSSVGYSQRDGVSPSGVFTFPSNGSRLRFP